MYNHHRRRSSTPNVPSWILGRIGREPPGVLFLSASRLIAFAIHRPSSFSSSFSLLLSMAQNGFCYSSFFDGRFFRCMKTFVLAFANPPPSSPCPSSPAYKQTKTWFMITHVFSCTFDLMPPSPPAQGEDTAFFLAMWNPSFASIFALFC